MQQKKMTSVVPSARALKPTWLLGLVVYCALFCYCGADFPQLSSDDAMITQLTASTESEDWEPVEHQTLLGTITGRKEPTIGLHRLVTHYYAFRGIPYAEPPVGSLRLEEPVEARGRWAGGHLNASTFRPSCPQYNHKHKLILGDEDCLYLNVYTPKLPESREGSKGLPVFVFIHGGGYVRGSASSHGAARLLAHNVVLVTFNYRLGALGFISTNDTTIPGNYGVLDQIAALQWVKFNIDQFGGDPNRVTLGGFSAGAASAHLFMLSPRSRGLMHRAVIMSGSTYCSWATSAQPQKYASVLAQGLGCPFNSSAQLKSCIASKTYQEILTAQAPIMKYEFWPVPFSVVVDAGLRDNPVLPGPIDSLPPSTPMPVLIGTVPQEGLLFALGIILTAEQPDQPSAVYEECVQYIIKAFWPNLRHASSVAQLAEAFYYSPGARHSLDTLAEEMTEQMTDYLFASCVNDAVVALASAKYTVYSYVMTHRDPVSPVWAQILYNEAKKHGLTTPLLTNGVSHGDTLLLIFSSKEAGTRNEAMSHLLTSTWSQFISTGRVEGGAGSHWTPVAAGKPVGYYNISLQPAMVYTPYRPREMNFWSQVIPLMEKTIDSLTAIPASNIPSDNPTVRPGEGQLYTSLPNSYIIIAAGTLIVMSVLRHWY
nr:esterase E4-like isoform X1 [Procambarus clarkii]XP_045582390.1 esterase E4-like isoform X1 [Procambarus clarkii]